MTGELTLGRVIEESELWNPQSSVTYAEGRQLVTLFGDEACSTIVIRSMEPGPTDMRSAVEVIAKFTDSETDATDQYSYRRYATDVSGEVWPDRLSPVFIRPVDGLKIHEKIKFTSCLRKAASIVESGVLIEREESAV